MKKVFRILIFSLLILNLSTKFVHGEILSLIGERLESIGIQEKYSDNIISHINNLNLSKEELQKISEDIDNMILSIQNKESYNDFSFKEMINIYGEVLNIMDCLNINVDLDLDKKEVILKSKDSKLTLIKCDINEAKKYYENYKQSPFTIQDYEELKSFIEDNSKTNKELENENIYNNKFENNDNTYLNDKELIEDSKEEINTDDSIKNNNKTYNTVSAIKRRNINRVLGIIFLVLFACVSISILINYVFFNKEDEKKYY